MSQYQNAPGASQADFDALSEQIGNYLTWTQIDSSSGSDISYTNTPSHDFLIVVSTSVYRFPFSIPVVALVANANNYYSNGYYNDGSTNATAVININTATKKVSLVSCTINGVSASTKTMTVYKR